MSKVSINLVTWNGERYILDCLDHLFKQTYDDFSILIIDNGSSDGTLELINEKYPHLKVVQHKENHGFAKAHNQAVHWSGGDYVLMLNQDIILQPRFLENMVGFMDQHPEAGACTGKLLSWQHQQKTNYIDTVGLTVYKNLRVVDTGSGELDQGQFDKTEEIFGVSGACPLYRREALEDVQMNDQFFDEDFFSYKEDVDLAFRLRWRGWKTFRVPSAIGYHDRSVAGPARKMTDSQIAKGRKNKSKFANFHSFRNHKYMLIKNLEKLNARIHFYEFKKLLYIFFAEQSSLKALKEVRKNKKKFLEKKKQIMEKRKIKPEEMEKWFI